MSRMAQDQSTEDGVGEVKARFSWVAWLPAGRDSGQATLYATRITKRQLP